MKHKIPTLKASLQAFVSKKGMSRLIFKAIRKAVKEESKIEQELDAAYEAANQDPDRLESLRDWNALDDVSNLIDGDEDWNWLREDALKKEGC
jgi:hypothetical protein